MWPVKSLKWDDEKMNEGGDDESVWCRKIGDKEGVGNVPENPQHPSP